MIRTGTCDVFLISRRKSNPLPSGRFTSRSTISTSFSFRISCACLLYTSIQRRPGSCWCTHGINGLCHRNRRRINRSKYHVHVWIKILLTEIYQKTKTYRLSCNHHKSLYVFYLSSAYSVSRILSTTLSFFPKQNATFGTTAPSMISTGNIRSIGVMIK